MPGLPRPLPIAMIIAFVSAAALLASAWPLLLYSTSLAAFGLGHVASELYYVDHRFGRRVGVEIIGGAAVLLLAVVLVRALYLTHVIGSEATVIELALVCALGALALPALGRRGGPPFVVAVVVVAALAVGAMVAPALTMVVLAIVHNATPVGFFLERAERHQRGRVLAASALVFFGVPLLVASGVVGDVAAGALVGNRNDNLTVLPTGPLRDHLYVYLPRSLHGLAASRDLFAAVVCAQLLHYGAVIGVLPRLIEAGDRPRLPWPRARVVVVIVVACAAGLVAHFAVAFAEARSIYGLAAGVHAWIEVPVLLLALGGVTHTVRAPQRPSQ